MLGIWNLESELKDIAYAVVYFSAINMYILFMRLISKFQDQWQSNCALLGAVAFMLSVCLPATHSTLIPKQKVSGKGRLNNGFGEVVDIASLSTLTHPGN
jgi:hypothetical protein